MVSKILHLLANTPAQSESLLLNLEQVAGDIGFYVKENIEYMYLTQDSINCTLK